MYCNVVFANAGMQLKSKILSITCDMNIQGIDDHSLIWEIGLSESQQHIDGSWQRIVDVVEQAESLKKHIVLTFHTPTNLSEEKKSLDCGLINKLSLNFSAKDKADKIEELGSGRIPKSDGESYFSYYVTYSQDWVDRQNKNLVFVMPESNKKYQQQPIMPLDGNTLTDSLVINFKERSKSNLGEFPFDIWLVNRYSGKSAPTANMDPDQNQYSSLISITASYE